MWIPLNDHQAECGVEDSYDEIVAYLDALAPDLLDPDAVAAFLECGPEMVRFLNAQVFDWSGRPIAGLYVASNTVAAVTALVYGGAGGTLGPGMTFGFIAGRHAAQQGSRVAG